jgi:hypothetical protein
MTYTLETTIGTLMKDPQARTLIDKYIPGASSNPMLGMVKNWTISTILSMPQATQMGMTREKAEALLAKLNEQAG